MYRMRVKETVVVICFVSVLAMAIAAPRPCKPNCQNNNQGKSGERKKNRQKANMALPETTRRQEEEEEQQHEDVITSESERLLAPFFALDANRDGYVTRKEYKTGSESENVNFVFGKYDTDEDRRISETEYLDYHRKVAVTVSCDTFAMERCATQFSNHLRTQEERLHTAAAADSTPSSNGLFCTALQIYVNCIGHERNVCRDIDTYAQRIKRTSIAYRNAGICPELSIAAFNAPNANSDRQHPTNRDVGETRRRPRGSRNIRAAKRTSLANEDCVSVAFASCHNELYASMAVRSRGCTITKDYRTCIKKSTKRCRDKSNVKKIMGGLKYIRKVHRAAEMCGLQT